MLKWFLLVAASLLAASPGWAAGVKVFEVPGLVTWVEVPGELQADGIPVKLQAAVSKWKTKDLAQFYVNEFQKAGLFIPREADQLEMTANPQLTGLDPAELVSYTVVFQPNKDGTTSVVFGTSLLGRRQPSGADFAPVIPGAGKVVRSDVEGMRSMVYPTSEPPKSVYQFYSETLRAAGYAEQEDYFFRRGDEELRVTTRVEKPGRTTVMVTRRLGAAAGLAPASGN